MIGNVDDVEAVPSAEIPSFACGWLVVDDDATSKRTKWVGVEVEGAVEVLPSRQGSIEGVLAQKVKCEFSLGEYFIP